MSTLSKPDPFWEVRIHELDTTKGISGLCVGYEQGKWRYEEFSGYIMEWLPEFCLKSKEREELAHQSAVKSLRKAANLVYQTDKYSKRGEFGEIFLHAAIRSIFNSLPAISKIYYKSSANNTVKGFDCVHVVGSIDDLELWLGEVKFYKDINKAIYDVGKEIEEHLAADFLRNEFILIGNKLDETDTFCTNVQKLISSRVSLDIIFKRVCVPVMLTYESDVVLSNSVICQEYIDAFCQEIRKYYALFCKKMVGVPSVRIHLFLLPLHEKDSLVESLHKKLKAWQNI